MWNVIVCDHNKAEQEKLTAYVQNCCKDAGVSVQIQGCADWTELAQKIKKAEPDMVIVPRMAWKGWISLPVQGFFPGRSSGSQIWISGCRHTACVSLISVKNRSPAQRWSGHLPDVWKYGLRSRIRGLERIERRKSMEETF